MTRYSQEVSSRNDFEGGHSGGAAPRFEFTETSYERLLQQSERVGDTLRIFTDDKLMSPRAIAVSKLQNFMDIASDGSAGLESRQVAALQAMDYITDMSTEVDPGDIDYMFRLWSDLPLVDAGASHYKERLLGQGDEANLEVLDKIDGERPISSEDWLNLRVGVDIPSLAELTQHVNIESILARSALVLDRVATATEYDESLLKDILELETFYAPLLYALGLPAWEAILKQHTEKARIYASGNHRAIAAYEEASAYIETVRSDGVAEGVLGDVIGITPEEGDFSFITNNTETPYGSKSYFSTIRYEDSKGIPVRLISRVKSPGSYAHKVLHNESYRENKPQDVFASTVIVSSVEEMVAVFKDVHGRVQQLDNCEFSVAASKASAVHVRGRQAYIDEVRVALGEGFDDIDTKLDDNGAKDPFQVLKVTFTMNDHPVEIQFQLREDRNAARLGSASHLCKGERQGGLPGNIQGDGGDLKKINDRKWNFLEGGDNIYLESDPGARRLQGQRMSGLKGQVLDLVTSPAIDQ